MQMRSIATIAHHAHHTASAFRARVWLPASCFFSRAEAQRHCWLWLLRSDGQVQVLLEPVHHLGYDDLLPVLLQRFEPEAPVPTNVPEENETVALPNAPIVPLPRWSVSWGHPLQRDIRSFANALDATVMEAMGDLEVQGACFGTVRNYNRLVRLPAPVRARRLQALKAFPAWLATVLLEPVARPQMLDDRHEEDRQWRDWSAPLHGFLEIRHVPPRPEDAYRDLLEAIDLGRDLIGAIARYYRVDRALVRSPLGREPWRQCALPVRLIPLLQALPAHARPRKRSEVEPRLEAIDALPVRLRSPEDAQRLARPFMHGWNNAWKTCERAYPNLPQALRDCRDFLHAALDTQQQAMEHLEMDVHRLGLAWLARRGLCGLLEASRHWHALPAREAPPVPSPREEPLIALFGAMNLSDGWAHELLTEDALFEEGEAMSHCVADYWQHCQLRGIRIVHLVTTAGEPATLQLEFDLDGSNREVRIAQLRGIHNANPSDAMRALAEEVLVRLADMGDALLVQIGLIAAQVRVARAEQRKLMRVQPTLRRQLDARLRTQLAQVLAYAQAQDGWRVPDGWAADEVVLCGSIAGFRHGPGEAVLDQLRSGDALALVREPDNPHDPRAIRIDWNGIKLGYVPRQDNAALALALDRGEHLAVAIRSLDDDAWAPVAFVVTRAAAIAAD